MIDTTKAKPLLERALAARALRQDLISSNIANIDTPFFKSRDVDFETTLTEKARQMYSGDEKKKLRLAITDSGHLSSKKMDLSQTHHNHLPGLNFVTDPRGTIFLRDGHMARNDANTVDLDVETTEMSKNAIMVSALTRGLKKQSDIFKSVLLSSSKI